ncbi:MAG: RDD family protein [Bacillota bacterium]
MSQKACPSCNAPNDVGATFCGGCGAPLSGSAPMPPSPPTYQPPTQANYQPPTPPDQGYFPPAQPPAASAQPGGYQQPGYGYAPGMDPDSARALQAAQAAGLAIPAGYAPAGFWVRLGAYLIDAVIIMLFAWIPIVGWIGAIFYFIFFWATKGQTPGKMALGLYVITTDGQPMSYGKAAIRYLGYMVSGFILAIGFLMIAFDDAKRGLHDRIANTLVVKRVG